VLDGLGAAPPERELPVQWTSPERALRGAPGKDRLPTAHLKLAVEQAILEGRQRGGRQGPCSLTEIQERLWREDPDDVARTYDALVVGGLGSSAVDDGGGRHGRLAERMRELRRPLPWRRKAGLTLQAIADGAGLDRATLAALMERQGYLELVPYGGRQRRRLVTKQAFDADLGHNADGSHRRIGRLEGMARAVVFPVFYPDKVPSILWSLDYEGIAARAASIGRKRERMRWLLHHHPYLPDAELAKLGGYSVRGVEKARASSVHCQAAR
jgi:hypothetical protein